ncbi:MAG: hypothetical protein IPJ65_19885 [Archangiaceae bacterium]|nr:hypothetical protein [Archangiaceae bacterium]
MLTAFFRALRVETGQADLVVGTAISGRELPLPDVAEMFGCFARALPVRAQVSGGDARADLQRVSAAFHASSAHAGVPLERIASVVKRESGARCPAPPSSSP